MRSHTGARPRSSHLRFHPCPADVPLGDHQRFLSVSVSARYGPEQQAWQLRRQVVTRHVGRHASPHHFPRTTWRKGTAAMTAFLSRETPCCATTPSWDLRLGSAVFFWKDAREDSKRCDGEDQPPLTTVRWLVHGTSLVRCSPVHVRGDVADVEHSCTDNLEPARSQLGVARHWCDSIHRF